MWKHSSHFNDFVDSAFKFHNTSPLQTSRFFWGHYVAICRVHISGHVWTTLPCTSTPLLTVPRGRNGPCLGCQGCTHTSQNHPRFRGNPSLVMTRYIIVHFSVTCQDLQMAKTVKVNGVISQVSWALVASHGDFPPWLCIKRHSLPDRLQSKGRVTSHPAFITSYFSTIISSVDTPLHRQKCLKNR